MQKSIFIKLWEEAGIEFPVKLYKTELLLHVENETDN